MPSLFIYIVGLASLVGGLFIAYSLEEVQQDSKKKRSPKVLAVYPTSDTLPENLLRFYVQFSQPMKAVNNLENVKLLDEKGIEIKGAIFNNVYELWDSEQKQLTLILDPARVKTGLVAHQSLGRALQINKHYQLVIETAEDIDSTPLDTPFVKDFFISEADTIIPQIDNWTIITPKKNSDTPLKIIFPQILDRQSLLNRIWVTNSKHKIIEGSIVISNHEKEWQFVPKEKWMQASYLLHVNGRLEDPAGNNLNGLFDHPLGSLQNIKEGEKYEVALFY